MRLVCRKLCHKLYFSRYLSATSQDPVFAQPSEQRTDNPRVVNSVLTAIKLNFVGSDLIATFLCPTVFLKGSSTVRRAYFSHMQETIIITLRN